MFTSAIFRFVHTCLRLQKGNMAFTLLVVQILVAVASAHGVLKTPLPRTVRLLQLKHLRMKLTIYQSGTAQAALCGAAVSSKLNSDPAGPIENAMAKADADYKCNAYLCRGFQYEDNKGRVQQYSAGQVVPFYVDLVAAHKPGWAVSQSGC